jgi:hypothetical protein
VYGPAVTTTNRRPLLRRLLANVSVSAPPSTRTLPPPEASPAARGPAISTVDSAYWQGDAIGAREKAAELATVETYVDDAATAYERGVRSGNRESLERDDALRGQIAELNAKLVVAKERAARMRRMRDRVLDSRSKVDERAAVETYVDDAATAYEHGRAHGIEDGEVLRAEIADLKAKLIIAKERAKRMERMRDRAHEKGKAEGIAEGYAEGYESGHAEGEAGNLVEANNEYMRGYADGSS